MEVKQLQLWRLQRLERQRLRLGGTPFYYRRKVRLWEKMLDVIPFSMYVAGKSLRLRTIVLGSRDVNAGSCATWRSR